MKITIKIKTNIKPPKQRNYLNDVDLLYEIILSKGKGKLTKNAEKMFINLVTELSKKFIYYNPDDRYDCMQSALLKLLTSWQKFDELKYDKPFRYFTEMAKRSMANEINILRWKDWKETPKLVRFKYNNN